MNVSFNKSVNPSGNVHSTDGLTYTLNVTVTGNSINGAVITDTLPTNVTYAGPGVNVPIYLPAPVYNPSLSQLTWNLPPLAPGTYQLSYVTKVNDLVPGGTNIINGAQLTYSGITLSSAVTVMVIGQYTVNVGVFNEAGELVRTIKVELLSQPIDSISLSGTVITTLNGANNAVDIYYKGTLIGSWNGMNASGDPSPNGIYHVKVDSVNPTGVVSSVTQQVMVSRSLYKATVLIYNESGEVVKHLYAFVDDPGKAAVMGVQLSTTVIKPSNNPIGGTPNQLGVILSNGTTIIWDGRSDAGTFVQTGQYFVEVHSVDGKGGTTTVTEQVSVQAADVPNLVLAQPNILDAKKGVLGTTFTAATTNLTLRVYIYTVAGERVATLDGLAGQSNVYWNVSGLASGIYIAVVDAKDPGGNLVAHQTVKVLILH